MEMGNDEVELLADTSPDAYYYILTQVPQLRVNHTGCSILLILNPSLWSLALYQLLHLDKCRSSGNNRPKRILFCRKRHLFWCGCIVLGDRLYGAQKAADILAGLRAGPDGRIARLAVLVLLQFAGQDRLPGGEAVFAVGVGLRGARLRRHPCRRDRGGGGEERSSRGNSGDRPSRGRGGHRPGGAGGVHRRRGRRSGRCRPVHVRSQHIPG